LATMHLDAEWPSSTSGNLDSTYRDAAPPLERGMQNSNISSIIRSQDFFVPPLQHVKPFRFYVYDNLHEDFGPYKISQCVQDKLRNGAVCDWSLSVCTMEHVEEEQTTYVRYRHNYNGKKNCCFFCLKNCQPQLHRLILKCPFVCFACQLMWFKRIYSFGIHTMPEKHPRPLQLVPPTHTMLISLWYPIPMIVTANVSVPNQHRDAKTVTVSWNHKFSVSFNNSYTTLMKALDTDTCSYLHPTISIPMS
jgi:hypothetical protein